MNGPPPPRAAIPTASDLLGPAFLALAGEVPTGIVLVDAEERPVFRNPPAAELLGSGSALPEVVQSWLRSDPSGAPREVRLEVPGGVRRVLLRAVRVDEARLVLLEDRTRTEAFAASLVLATRVQAGVLLRSQAHDLKAPLNALALHIELLRRSLDEEEGKPSDVREDQVGTIDVLQREIKRLGRSLEFFLRHATRAEPPSRALRAFDVRRPVREIARLVRAAGRGHGIRVRTDLPKTAVRVVANADLLKQALLNVALNAVEAQPDGGEIRLRVQARAEAAGVLVEDDGPGIPPHLRERVFDMSFTSKDEGTGIGLTVARSLVEDQGGRLRLDSRPGGGTTIEILLPTRSE